MFLYSIWQVEIKDISDLLKDIWSSQVFISKNDIQCAIKILTAYNALSDDISRLRRNSRSDNEIKKSIISCYNYLVSMASKVLLQ